MSLTKEQIKKSFIKRLKEIEVPQWGGSVFLKPLTVKELIKWNSIISDHVEDLASYQSELVLMSVVDEYGHPLFDKDDNVDDLSFEAIKHVINEITEFNGFTRKASEDIGKKNTDNADPAISDGSCVSLAQEPNGDIGVASN